MMEVASGGSLSKLAAKLSPVPGDTMIARERGRDTDSE